jgi:hypothetical protein
MDEGLGGEGSGVLEQYLSSICSSASGVSDAGSGMSLAEGGARDSLGAVATLPPP